MQDRWTAAVEDWCSVQIGVHDTGSWCSCPCGFLPAYQRGVGWQVPMMQHEPWCVPACPADRQSQISWKERLGSLIITGQLLSSDPSPPARSSREGTVDSGLLHVFYRRGQYRYLNTICSLQITFLSLSNTVIWHGTVQMKKIPWLNGFFSKNPPTCFLNDCSFFWSICFRMKWGEKTLNREFAAIREIDSNLVSE